MDKQQLIDLYEQRVEERAVRLRAFLEEDRPDFLILQHPEPRIFGRCNSIEEICRNNLDHVWEHLQVDWTDDLPYLEPWIGTGVVASIFGCRYRFRDFDAPHAEYLYHKVTEVVDMAYPDWRKSPIARMMLDCIDALKECTGGRIPISLTDTQSPFDTATLILDACEVFANCYEAEELVLDFLQKITNVIVEFSRVQAARIGAELLARPGHLMPSIPGGPGISVSDDNLTVSSPRINEKIALPFDQQIADAFDGIVIHSCGTWTHTMKLLREMPGLMGIECQVGHHPHETDTDPNPPADVRQVMAGSKAIVKARMGSDIEAILAALGDLADGSLRLVVQVGRDPPNAERNYRLLEEKLQAVYENASAQP